MCPTAKKVITAITTTRVYWDEPLFTDNVQVVEIVRSHAPGQVFTWGDFVVSYVAKDAFGNAVSCVFEVYVTRKYTLFTYVCNAGLMCENLQ